MEYYIKENVSNITYLSELTPTPIVLSKDFGQPIGVGVKFAQTTYVHFVP